MENIPPEVPRVTGAYQMTREWSITLPDEFAKRFEESDNGSDLVLWRSGITCWISIYGAPEGATPASTLAWLREDPPQELLQTYEVTDALPLRYGYLQQETPEDDAKRWSLMTFTVGNSGHVMMAIYFDAIQDLETAQKIWFSLTETPLQE